MTSQRARADEGVSAPAFLPGVRRYPYRSRLLSSVSTLILIWDSPALQSEIFEKTGVSLDQPAQEALRHLLAWGRIRPSVLAEILGTGASNVSKIVGRLVEDDLVERLADEADGRACLIVLTRKGETAAREVYGLGDRMIAEVLEGWPVEQVEEYTALTERFVSDAVNAAAQMRQRGLRPEAIPPRGELPGRSC